MVESGPSGTAHFFREKMADRIARCQFHERPLKYCHFGTCGPVAFYILKWRAFKEKVKKGLCIFRISVLSFINANCGFKYPHVHGFEEDIPPHNHE